MKMVVIKQTTVIKQRCDTKSCEGTDNDSRKESSVKFKHLSAVSDN